MSTANFNTCSQSLVEDLHRLSCWLSPATTHSKTTSARLSARWWVSGVRWNLWYAVTLLTSYLYLICTKVCLWTAGRRTRVGRTLRSAGKLAGRKSTWCRRGDSTRAKRARFWLVILQSGSTSAGAVATQPCRWIRCSWWHHVCSGCIKLSNDNFRLSSEQANLFFFVKTWKLYPEIFTLSTNIELFLMWYFIFSQAIGYVHFRSRRPLRQQQ